MKLYSYWRSSASWRVRTALAYKGLSYDYVPVHLTRDGGEQHKEAYREKNPMRQVPLLELDDGRTLAQSVAILEYLEEVFPEPPLLPRDPYLRGKVRQLVEVVNAGIQPFQNLATTTRLRQLGVDPDAWVKEWIRRGLEAFEREVAQTAGRFCVGDSPTFADVVLVPQCYSSRRFGVDLTPYENILKIEKNCLELDAFRRAHPEAQPDAER
nr:MAG: maleylacetoacetate isomerase [Pseudomonadota bacterium]